MLRLYSYTFTWSLFCLGLYFMLHHCDARAVNISNTWTMPQGGLNVFYRFFRDRISWFEADAVCQFHHANLVTVDNSFQFDATRDLLRELDVNDIVWIGLMRPQNSERFIWSNSKPLITDAGYWAESLPLMDAPLCAVIDPIRDYRWHALRCGGPETASFLCEMPVPNWAEACLLKDVSHITMQYMADTASIELIKNCQQEGLLKATCKGKQDREQITQSLKCPSENIEAQQLQGITNSRLKSSQIVNGIATDNNESNNIELLPLQSNNYGSRITSSVLNSENMPTEKNAVQKLIEQFNVDELMQADEPKTQIQSGNDYYKLGAIIPNPVKKSIKKIGELIKKDVAKEKLDSMNEETNQHNHFGNINDKMIADQRANGEPEIVEHILDDVTNEIAEPLPHIKKIRPQDLHTAAIIQEKFHNKDDLKKLVGNDEMKNTKEKNLEESVELSSTIPIYNHNNEKSNVMKHKNQIKSSFKGKQLSGQEEFAKIADSTITIEVEPQMTTTIASITHPIHPQMQPRNIPSHETESQHPLQHNGHVKETPDNSHFIPPMLLVKSHYISNNNRQHSSSHSSTHHDFPEELTHDNKHQLNKNNEKDINEKFSSSVEKSNSMKMAEAIFQNRSDIPATTIAVAAAPPAPPAAAPPAPPAAAAAAATTTTTTTTATKLIVHDYQQGFTPNFVNMTKEKETNADTTNHENNPFTIEHHNDDNNNNSKHNNDTMNEFQELSTTLQIIHSKTAQQKMHKQRQEQEQKQELEQQQELQTKQQQLKLNKYEHIDNESNANGKSSKEVLLQQHQQHENNSNNFAVTTTTTTTTNKNNKFNKKVVLLTTTTTTSALTTNKMHDLVEAKLSQNSPTKSPTTFHTNADKLKEWIMEEHAMTTKVLEEEEKAKKREEFKVKTEAATQSELQIKQQENVTPITTVIAAAETTITAIKMEPSLDEKIIVAAQKNVDITEIVTPTKQSAEMLSLTTITETQKQIDDKLDIKMEQKKSLEQMEQMEQTDGIKATIKAEREGEVAITTKLAATSLNGQAASLTNNSSNTSGDVDLVEPTTTTQKAKIEERAIYANTTEDIAAAMASEAHNLKIQSGNADAISATSSELFETSKSTATTITTTAAAAAAAIETNFETTMRNFLKLTTEESYKPNRRRALTKPKSVSYIKKILG